MAATSGARPSGVTPPEENAEIWCWPSCPLPSWAPSQESCVCTRKAVVPAALMTCGSSAGEPTVPVGPASPVDTTTVTPAAVAASLAATTVSWVVSGIGLNPKDSLMTSTFCRVTA